MPYKNKEEQQAAQARHYHDNKEVFLDRNTMRRDARKEWVDALYASFSCMHCGENAPECLDFHHVNPETKVDGISKMVNQMRSMQAICEEVEKCVVLCSNCHRKHHKGTIILQNLTEHKVKVPNELRDTAYFQKPGSISGLLFQPEPSGIIGGLLGYKKPY